MKCITQRNEKKERNYVKLGHFISLSSFNPFSKQIHVYFCFLFSFFFFFIFVVLWLFTFWLWYEVSESYIIYIYKWVLKKASPKPENHIIHLILLQKTENHKAVISKGRIRTKLKTKNDCRWTFARDSLAQVHPH